MPMPMPMRPALSQGLSRAAEPLILRAVSAPAQRLYAYLIERARHVVRE